MSGNESVQQLLAHISNNNEHSDILRNLMKQIYFFYPKFKS